MTNYDPNLFTLHISKLAAIQVIQNTNSSSIVLRKQCWKKLNEKFILVKTEIDLTLNELQLISEAAKLALYLCLLLKRLTSQSHQKCPAAIQTNNGRFAGLFDRISK